MSAAQRIVQRLDRARVTRIRSGRVHYDNV